MRSETGWSSLDVRSLDTARVDEVGDLSDDTAVRKRRHIRFSDDTATRFVDTPDRVLHRSWSDDIRCLRSISLSPSKCPD